MDYSSTASTSNALLTSFGTSMTLRVTTAGTYDPATGSETGATTTDHSTVGVLTNIKDYRIDNELVLAGDKVVLMSPNVSVAPQPGNYVVVGGVHWRVVAVNAVEPDGTPVLYKLQVRRG